MQSLLAALLRSFAAPVAAGAVLAGISLLALMADISGALLSPDALVTRTTQLGTGVFADAGAVCWPDIAVVLGVAGVAPATLLVLGTAVVDRRGVR